MTQSTQFLVLFSILFVNTVASNQLDAAEKKKPVPAKNSVTTKKTTPTAPAVLTPSPTPTPIVLAPSAPKPEVTNRTDQSLTPQGSHQSRDQYGVAASYLSNKMIGTFSYSGKSYTANMGGTGYGLVGYYDHPYSEPFGARVVTGIEQFNAAEVQSSNICDGGKSTNCGISLVNLSLYAEGKVTAIPGGFPIWLAGGLGGWIPISKVSTIFDSSSIGPMLVYVLSGGTDFKIFSQQFSLSGDYLYLSGSSNYTGDSLIVRLGYTLK